MNGMYFRNMFQVEVKKIWVDNLVSNCIVIVLLLFSLAFSMHVCV